MNPDGDYFDEAYYKPKDEGGKGDYIRPFTWENEKEHCLKVAHQLDGLFDLRGKKLLEIGCAKGFVIKALLSLGIDAYGCDISKWVIEHCDPEVKDRVKVCDARNLPDVYQPNSFDIIYTASTLEHIPLDQMSPTLLNMTVCSKEWIYISVPIALGLKNEPDITDPTHMTFMNPSWWIKLFFRYDFIIDLPRSRQFDEMIFCSDGKLHSYHHAELVFRKERLRGDGRRLLDEDLIDFVKVIKAMSFIDQQSVIQSIEEKV